MAIYTTGSAPAPECTNRGIADHIRVRIIHEGLELEEIGIELAEVTDDVPLFDDDGLNLDSIDALEVLAGVQREFGLSFLDVDQAFMTEHCSTVGRLARLVESMSVDQVVRGQAADTGTWRQAPGAGIGGRNLNAVVAGLTPNGVIGGLSPNAGVEERPADPAAESRALPGGRDA